MSVLLRCACGAEAPLGAIEIEHDGCPCCSEPYPVILGPHGWSVDRDRVATCPACHAERRRADEERRARYFERIEDAMKRANAKARYGDDDD